LGYSQIILIKDHLVLKPKVLGLPHDLRTPLGVNARAERTPVEMVPSPLIQKAPWVNPQSPPGSLKLAVGPSLS
jgi:hypothetical protein